MNTTWLSLFLKTYIAVIQPQESALFTTEVATSATKLLQFFTTILAQKLELSKATVLVQMAKQSPQ